MDVHDRRTRSYNMSRIRSRDTKPELRLRQHLWRAGLRGYRLHVKLPGKPDLVFGRRRVAVFVDGCFWHGCPKCGDGRAPLTNTSYWGMKRLVNQERDRRQSRELRAKGWKVVRIWEHEVMRNPERCVARIARALGT